MSDGTAFTICAPSSVETGSIADGLDCGRAGSESTGLCGDRGGDYAERRAESGQSRDVRPKTRAHLLAKWGFIRGRGGM